MLLGIAAIAPAASPPVPATLPTTSPTSRTAEMEPLADGTVRFAPPPGWIFVSKKPNDLGATYKSPDDSAIVLIEIQPLNRVVKESSRDPMARIIDKGIRDAAAHDK